MKKLQTILEWALLLFTALLGLKFTNAAGTPEIPAFYGSDAASIFYGTAPSFLFVFKALRYYFITSIALILP